MAAKDVSTRSSSHAGVPEIAHFLTQHILGGGAWESIRAALGKRLAALEAQKEVAYAADLAQQA